MKRCRRAAAARRCAHPVPAYGRFVAPSVLLYVFDRLGVRLQPARTSRGRPAVRNATRQQQRPAKGRRAEGGVIGVLVWGAEFGCAKPHSPFSIGHMSMKNNRKFFTLATANMRHFGACNAISSAGRSFSSCAPGWRTRCASARQRMRCILVMRHQVSSITPIGCRNSVKRRSSSASNGLPSPRFKSCDTAKTLPCASRSGSAQDRARPKAGAAVHLGVETRIADRRRRSARSRRFGRRDRRYRSPSGRGARSRSSSASRATVSQSSSRSRSTRKRLARSASRIAPSLRVKARSARSSMLRKAWSVASSVLSRKRRDSFVTLCRSAVNSAGGRSSTKSTVDLPLIVREEPHHVLIVGDDGVGERLQAAVLEVDDAIGDVEDAVVVGHQHDGGAVGARQVLHQVDRPRGPTACRAPRSARRRARCAARRRARARPRRAGARRPRAGSGACAGARRGRPTRAWRGARCGSRAGLRASCIKSAISTFWRADERLDQVVDWKMKPICFRTVSSAASRAAELLTEHARAMLVLRRAERADEREQRRLPAARRAGHDHDLALGDVGRDVEEDLLASGSPDPYAWLRSTRWRLRALRRPRRGRACARARSARTPRTRTSRSSAPSTVRARARR